MPTTTASTREQRAATRSTSVDRSSHAEKRAQSPPASPPPSPKKAKTTTTPAAAAAAAPSPASAVRRGPSGSNTSTRWYEVYERLKAYHEAHGDCNVPYEFKFDKPLGHWVRHQRLRHKENLLEEDRREALDALGFDYALTNAERAGGTPSRAGSAKSTSSSASKEKKWLEVLERLKAYKEAFGDCNVPYEYKSDKPLGYWVRTQRIKHKEGKLEESRQEALDALGFDYALTNAERAGGAPRAKSAPKATATTPPPQGADAQASLKTRCTDCGYIKCRCAGTAKSARCPTCGYAKCRCVQTPTTPTQGATDDPVAQDAVVDATTALANAKAAEKAKLASASKEDKWMMHMEKLKEWKALHGHTDVPMKNPEDQTFSNWVRMQRDLYNYPNRGTIRPERLVMLDAIGFDWKTPKNRKPPKTFEEQMEDLKKYHAEHGHIKIPPSEKTVLANFLNTQRYLYKEEKLSDERKAELEALGMDWTMQVQKERKSIGPKPWEEYYTEVKEYYLAHGNSFRGLKKQKRSLINWMDRQKEAYHDQKLTQEQIEQLEGLGMDWTLPPRQRTWDEFLATLVAFFLAHGHTNVPPTHTEDLALYAWVLKQRELFHAGQMSEDQATQLKALLFDFSLPPKKLTWSEMLEKYQEREEKKKQQAEGGAAPAVAAEMEEETGDNASTEFEAQLDNWVIQQKERKSKGKLTEGQLERLREAGFDFTLPKRASRWDQQYESLKKYAVVHGNINNVTASYEEEPTLCHWVCRQRDLFHKMKLSEEQAKLLNALGMDWDGAKRYKYSSEDIWQAHFAILKAFQEEHGHCGVPNDFPEDPSLWEWIHLQHVNFQKNRMPQERIDKLESIGFVWQEVVDADDTDTDDDDPDDGDLKMPARVSTCGGARTPRISWKQHYDSLKSYKEMYDTYNVPDAYDPKLSEWVRAQRRQYKTQKGLLPEKVEKLNEIGFNWDGPDRKEPAPSTPKNTTPLAAAAAGRLPNSTSAAAKPPPTPASPMVPNALGAAPNSTLAIASAAAAAAKKASEEEHREERSKLINQVSQLRTAMHNLQALNESLKEQLQEKDEAHEEEKNALEETLESHVETMRAQEGTIQSQTVQIQQLTQQLETLREARRMDALRAQPVHQANQPYQQQQPPGHAQRFYDSYQGGNLR